MQFLYNIHNISYICYDEQKALVVHLFSMVPKQDNTNIDAKTLIY